MAGITTHEQTSAIGAEPRSAGAILVVDDYEDNRVALARRLQRHGYQLDTAIDGVQALEFISKKAYDLVLLDVMMPGMSGLEVLKILRETYTPTQLPIIMATAKDRTEDIVAAFALGANDYVIKPLDFAVVLARVQTQLLMKRSVDQVMALEKQLTAQNAQLQLANERLNENAARTARDLAAAARIQKAALPKVDRDIPGVGFSWVFEPCDELAGDSLNVLTLDDEHVAFYVLDVSGHGVAASLMAVAATRLLSLTGDGNSIVQDFTGGKLIPTLPATVAARLNQRFTWDDTLGRFLTLFYALYNVKTRQLQYVSAGHPGAIRLKAGAGVETLEGDDLPIGVGDGYSERSLQLNAHDRLYLYSDGVTEAMNASMALFGINRLESSLAETRADDLNASVASIVRAIAAWQEGTASRDDVTILAMEVK